MFDLFRITSHENEGTAGGSTASSGPTLNLSSSDTAAAAATTAEASGDVNSLKCDE